MRDMEVSCIDSYIRGSRRSNVCLESRERLGTEKLPSSRDPTSARYTEAMPADIISLDRHTHKPSLKTYYNHSGAIPRQIEKVRRWQPFLLGTKLLGMDIAQRLEHQLLESPKQLHKTLQWSWEVEGSNRLQLNGILQAFTSKELIVVAT